MYLLDTNVISELRKIGDGKADPNVVAWQASIGSENFYLSPITVLELQLGILRLMRRAPERSQRLNDWLRKIVLPEFEGRILLIDAQIAIRCASLHMPQNRPHNDAWIAATALVHKMTVVTRNVTDFTPTGVALLNPWDARP